MKEDESKIAKLAIKQFGSIKKYTEAMRYNMEHISELTEKAELLAVNNEHIMEKNDALYLKLTSDMDINTSSKEVQDIIQEIVLFTQEQLITSNRGGMVTGIL